MGWEYEEVDRGDYGGQREIYVECLSVRIMSHNSGQFEHIRLTQRHVALLTEKAPPITGPRMAPIPQETPIRAFRRGASLSVPKIEK